MCPANELKSRAPAPAGHVEFDDRGNAIWQIDEPGMTCETAFNRVLDGLELSLEEAPARFGTVTESPKSLEKGFDPYSSGCVVRDSKNWRRTDLRALSEEIKRKRQSGAG